MTAVDGLTLWLFGLTLIEVGRLSRWGRLRIHGWLLGRRMARELQVERARLIAQRHAYEAQVLADRGKLGLIRTIYETGTDDIYEAGNRGLV